MRHAALLVFAVAFLVPAPAASAAGATEVPGMTHFYGMAVTSDHIYLSPGVSGSSIAIMNPDGTQAGTIDNVPGAAGMVVVGDVLYVAAYGGSKIARFDLTTDPATPLSSFSTYPLASPLDLTYAGGRLWFTSLCEQWGSHVARMPIDDGMPVRELKGSNGDWNYCTELDAGPYAPNRIFLHSRGVSPQTLYEYDVTKGLRPALVTSDPWEWGSYNGAPAEPLPGGDEFALAWTGGVGTFRLSDMFGPTGTYSGGGGSSLVATDRNGGLLAAGSGGPYVTEVTVFRLGQYAPLRSIDFSSGATEMWPNGLAFAASGKRLFAVTGAYDDRVVFRVIHLGTLT
jgi:hypothetical protein